MSVQSLSIVVPSNHCINNCRFCVACGNQDGILYPDQMDDNLPFYDLYFQDYLKRLEYARDVGVQTVMLTGNCEPQQNRKFLKDFGLMMMIMDHPFRNIEMQTTGRLLDANYLRFLRNHVGVSTISLSVSSFGSKENRKLIGCPDSTDMMDLPELCAAVRKYDFNLRLSLNLSTALFEGTRDTLSNSPECAAKLLGYCKDLGADQVTLRQLFVPQDGSSQAEWVQRYGLLIDKDLSALRTFIKENGEFLNTLPYGAQQYSVYGMSVVLDDDCMAKGTREDFKYLILRPNCKLYSRWDSKSSLVF